MSCYEPAQLVAHWFRNIGLFSTVRSMKGHNLRRQNLCISSLKRVSRDSTVGIATRYGLDGPGIESQWVRDFPHPSRPTLGPNQPSIQWTLGPYTSTPPLSLYGLLYGELNFSKMNNQVLWGVILCSKVKSPTFRRIIVP